MITKNDLKNGALFEKELSLENLINFIVENGGPVINQSEQKI